MTNAQMAQHITKAFNESRHGANLEETKLTPAYLKTTGIRVKNVYRLDDDARGIEGAPLVVPNLTMRDGAVHEVVFFCTMGNNVYAFDRQTYHLLWRQRIGNPVANSAKIDWYDINDGWGILGTGRIDVARNRLYCVALSSPDRTLANGRFYLHALNLLDGSAAAPPLDLMNATYQPPDGLPLQRFSSFARKQRCALAFDSRNGIDTVFVCAGSFIEDRNNQGWAIACDVTGPRMSIAASFTTCSRYDGGGVWMGGQGPVVAPDGRLRFMSGNGAFNGLEDFSNCFLALRYSPKTATKPASLAMDDYACFYTDTGLVGADPTLPALSLILGYNAGSSMLPTNKRDFDDVDLGSGGELYMEKEATGFASDLTLGAGKDGRWFLVRSNNMGKPPLSWFSKENMAKVYATAAGPIGWFTYYQPGNPMPLDVTELDVTWENKTRHQHGTPAFYRSSIYGPMVFTMGENSPLRAFQVVELPNDTYTLKYLGCSREVASAQVTTWGGGMPGGFVSISANGSGPDTAVVWCSFPYGDGNKTVSWGRTVAYAAESFVDGIMELLWDTEAQGIAYKHVKFLGTVPVNGQVLLPSYDGTVLEIG